MARTNSHGRWRWLGLTVSAFLAMTAGAARAQFATAVVDGVANAGEYGTQTDGANAQTSGSRTWYLTWDDSNLYIGQAGNGSTLADPTLIYVDTNPAVPVNGGSNAEGSLTGATYDRCTPNLPFRADFLFYFKDGAAEYRISNGSGGWSAPVATGFVVSASGATREASIPWSAITGTSRPASFNWVGFNLYDYGAADNGVRAPAPTQNTSGARNLTAYTYDVAHYYSVLSSADGAATLPFAKRSFTFVYATDQTGFGGYTFHDFTMNSTGRTLTRTTAAIGNITVEGTLRVNAGTLAFAGSGTGAGSTTTVANLVVSGGTLSMGAATQPITVSGDVTFSGGTFTTSSANGGDLKITGNYTHNAGATVNWGSRVLYFENAGTSTIDGTASPIKFGGFRANKSVGASLVLAKDITFQNAQAFSVSQANAGTFDVNGRKVRFLSSGTTTLSNTGVALSFGDIDVATPVSCTLGPAITGTATFSGFGAFSGAAPTWGPASTLVYSQPNNTPGTEWLLNASSGAGVPNNLTITGTGTNLDAGLSGTNTRRVAGTFTIESPATFSLAGRLILLGDLTIQSGATYSGSTGERITFAGNAVQTLNALGPIHIGDLRVSGGVSLNQAGPEGNLTFDTLSMSGTWRRTESISGPGLYSFGYTGLNSDYGTEVEVTNPGAMTALTVEYTPGAHPTGSNADLDPGWWTLTPTGSGATITVTLTHALSPSRRAAVAQWTGSGTTWSYGSTASTTTTVSRSGITNLSQPFALADLPAVLSVSTIASDGTYNVGDLISIDVVFSEPITVYSAGGLALELNSGGSAVYQSGSGTDTLTFHYTVGAGDDASALDVLSAASLVNGNLGNVSSGPGCAVRTVPVGADPNSLASDASIVIDGLVPTIVPVSIVSSNPTPAWARIGDTITVSFTASEPLATPPTVTIAGESATVTNPGGTTYSATLLVSGTTAEGPASLNISGYADAAGNAGATITSANSGSVTIDRTTPGVPQTPMLATASDSGQFNNDAVTNDNTPLLQGLAPDNSIITITSSIDGVVGTTSNLLGSWTHTLAAPLSDGQHQITVVASDAAGNASAASPAKTLSIDTAAPTSVAAADSLTVAQANITGTFTTADGSGVGATHVRIYHRKSDGSWIAGNYFGGGGGNWVLTPAGGAGTYHIKTVATDLAGNQEAAPSGTVGTGDVTVEYSGAANAPHTITVTTETPGPQVLQFPMEGSLIKVVITLPEVTHSGTITVQRIENSSGALAAGLNVAGLINQHWVITAGGGLTFSGTATIQFVYEEGALLNGLLESTLTHVYRVDNQLVTAVYSGANVSVNTVTNTVTVTGVTGFSSWYIGLGPATGLRPGYAGAQE